MSSAAELKAILLARMQADEEEAKRREAEREARAAEMVRELEELERREAQEAEERRVREEAEAEERRAREAAEAEQRAREEAEQAQELRLASPDDIRWLVGLLRARNSGEITVRNTEVQVPGGSRGPGTSEGACWACRRRRKECDWPE